MNTFKQATIRTAFGRAIVALAVSAASVSALAQSTLGTGAAGETPSVQMHKSMNDTHQKSMSMTMSGDTDHDFMMMMRSHHEAGIAMAQTEASRGQDKQAVNMAKKIIAAQKKEIKQIDDWMAKHHK